MTPPFSSSEKTAPHLGVGDQLVRELLHVAVGGADLKAVLAGVPGDGWVIGVRSGIRQMRYLHTLRSRQHPAAGHNYSATSQPTNQPTKPPKPAGPKTKPPATPHPVRVTQHGTPATSNRAKLPK
jgi:hypothetical protein